MKNHNTICKRRSRATGIKSLRRRQKLYAKKVKDARTISRKNSVIKNTIQIPDKYPTVYSDGMGKWEPLKLEKYPTYFKDTFKTKEEYKAHNRQMSNHRRLTHKEVVERYIEHKLAKWEKKNPKPCKDDDIFKKEFIPMWEEKRKAAKEQIIKSMTPRTVLTIEGRFMKKEGLYNNIKLGTIKDKFNEVPTFDCNKKSKLKTKIERMVTNKAKTDKTLVCLNLLNGDEKILVVPAA